MGIAAGVAAAAVGSAAGSMLSGGGSGGNTTSSSTPFNSTYLNGGNSAAQNYLNSEYLKYGLPNLSGATQQGISGLQSQAPINTGWLNSAGNAASNFANGSYVGSNPAYGLLGNMAAGGATNPYLDATYNHAAGQVRQQLDGEFEGNGRYGSGMQQYAVGDALNNLATQIYGGAYDANQNRALGAGTAIGQLAQGERQQQISGIGLAPSVVGGQIANSQGLLGAGQVQDQYNLASYWQPFDALARYNGIVSGNTGGTQQTPYFTNPVAGLLGGGILGLSAYNAFAGNSNSANAAAAAASALG